ncbi:hypothetical protein DYBT9275_03629 [Dyadobacter sp. CECT 9275]|uniref:MmcQ/YjbR family DNA-binding protein n=2 Tax=Dyadobacter helix TaxID=2822344 RepID=A0A916JDU5_9BACT|nr:hypothetical protein DYBT9275_03629 [Dyadobacter sp. CECT 9275]
MVDISIFRQIALSFPEATEEPHFEKTSFRIKKKIFATYNDKENQACVKLSERDQDLFCLSDKLIIFPVPNKWGKQGWTLVSLDKVQENVFLELLTCAYCAVAPEKLALLVRPDAE